MTPLPRWRRERGRGPSAPPPPGRLAPDAPRASGIRHHDGLSATLALPGSVDAVISLLAAERLRLRPAARDRAVPEPEAAAAAVPRRRARRRQDRARQDARARLGTALLRVQCYEGLDIAQTAYEWNVARQMIEIRLAEAAHTIHDEGDARAAAAQPVFARDADRAAAAAGADAGPIAGAADRRARSRRRALRCLPARGAGREPAHRFPSSAPCGAARRRSRSSPATARARSTTR